MTLEFTDEQKAYLASDINNHVFLEACPGSGKTEVIAAKIAKETACWDKFPGGIVVLSFANSATDELRSRISKYLPHISSYFPHFIGTFDSFVFKNIVSPLSKSLTEYDGHEGDYSLSIVETGSNLKYRTTKSIADKGSINAHHFWFDIKKKEFRFDSGNRALDLMRNNFNITDEEYKSLIEAKKRMLAGGFSTYRDIETLAIKSLRNKALEPYFKIFAKRYPLIIVDECQDLSFEQLYILQKLSTFGVKMHFIGDLHQAIYGFRDVDPNAVVRFTKDNDFFPLQLTQNFRSCQKIINMCSKLTGPDNIIGRITQLEPVCYLTQYENCPTELLNKFEELSQGYENNVIVARGHSLLQKFHTSASNLKSIHKLAQAIHLFDPNDMEALEESLTKFSEFIRSHLTVSVKPDSFNCPESIESNLKWRRFLYSSLAHFTHSPLKDMTLNWSDWVKKIKALIHSLSSNDFVNDEIKCAIEPLNSVCLSAPRGQTKEVVRDFFGEVTESKYVHRKTTIHGVKGETHDVTMLISTARDGGQPGSHWKSWLGSPDTESARFAYVASSRPKHRLIWAVKSLSTEEIEKFINLGFHVY